MTFLQPHFEWYTFLFILFNFVIGFIPSQSKSKPYPGPFYKAIKTQRFWGFTALCDVFWKFFNFNNFFYFLFFLVSFFEPWTGSRLGMFPVDSFQHLKVYTIWLSDQLAENNFWSYRNIRDLFLHNFVHYIELAIAKGSVGTERRWQLSYLPRKNSL